MDYISIKEASEEWGISERRIQKLCSEETSNSNLELKEQFGSAGFGQ